MIGKLQGIVDFYDDGNAIIMTGGVGYLVHTPDYLNVGDTVNLWIETVVREDSFRLFGFKSREGKELFTKLTSVSGLGPKGAMSILSSLKPDVLLSAIWAGDAKTITAAPGVGNKVAEKIILEMKGKIGGISFDDSGSKTTGDLLSALENLGYRRLDIAESVQNLVKQNPDFGIEKLLPLALKEISKK
jgi:Holliday junction DNA helicase RuvA